MLALFTFLVLIALLMGGAIAAWRQEVGRPLSHGIVTALLTFAAVQLVGIARRAIGGDDIRWGRIVSTALLTLMVGTIGGLAGRFHAVPRACGPSSHEPIGVPIVSVLVIDVGTSGLRAAVVRPDASVTAVHHRSCPPSTPFPGLVEFDAAVMAATVLEVAHAALAEAGPVQAVGITNQRASTVVWDRDSGEPVGPGLGWQDLRTVFDCMTIAGEHGLRLAPNQSATKLRWLLAELGRPQRPAAGLRHRRHVGRLDPVAGLAARDRPHQRRPHRTHGRQRP